MYCRNCPKCNKEIAYTIKGNRDKAEKKKQMCRNCSNNELGKKYIGAGNPFYGKRHSLTTVEKMKNKDMSYTHTKSFRQRRRDTSKKGRENPMYNTSVYELWVVKYGEKTAGELLAATKKKWSIAASGTNNPMYGKPPPQGSGNGWKGWYKNWFFRSLRELSYMINVIEKENLKWRSAETKDLRINYINWDGTPRTYSADFLIEEKYLVEIKPEKLKSSRTVRLKQLAAIEFCRKNNLEYRLLDIALLTNEEFLRLYKNNEIKFTERYEKMFLEGYENG